MIYIIRHGETEMNTQRLLQGRSNYPLNETGREQAKKAARALEAIRFDSVFSGPLNRAVETARIVAPYAEPIIDERLTEMEYGRYEGVSLHGLPPELAAFFRDFAHTPAPDGMEQLSSVAARVGAFIRELTPSSGNILISTHAIAMKGILEYLTPDSNGAYWSKYIGNCAVYVTDFCGDGFGMPTELCF